MLVSDERDQIPVDRLDAHLAGAVVRLSVSSQIWNDEAVVIFERIGDLPPFVGAGTRRSVHTQHRGTVSDDLVVEIEALVLKRRHALDSARIFDFTRRQL